MEPQQPQQPQYPSLHESKSTQDLNRFLLQPHHDNDDDDEKQSRQQQQQQSSVVKLEIWLIRHGETDYNAIGRLQGQLDIELNSLGIEQAHLVAKAISNHYLDDDDSDVSDANLEKQKFYPYIFSSDLRRAAQTGEIICDALNRRRKLLRHDNYLDESNSGQNDTATTSVDSKNDDDGCFKMVYDSRFREIHFGSHLEGKYWREVRHLFSIDAPNDIIGGDSNPNAESYALLQQRFNRGIESAIMHYLLHTGGDGETGDTGVGGDDNDHASSSSSSSSTTQATMRHKNILVTCHGGGIRTQTCQFLQIPLNMRTFQVHNTSIHRFALYVDRETSIASGVPHILKREVIELNNTSHLRVRNNSSLQE